MAAAQAAAAPDDSKPQPAGSAPRLPHYSSGGMPFPCASTSRTSCPLARPCILHVKVLLRNEGHSVPPLRPQNLSTNLKWRSEHDFSIPTSCYTVTRRALTMATSSATCPACGGTGFCRRCKGDGLVLDMLTRSMCPTCRGYGAVRKDGCPACGGSARPLMTKQFVECKECTGDGNCMSCKGTGHVIVQAET
jgi:hypothetical protein